MSFINIALGIFFFVGFMALAGYIVRCRHNWRENNGDLLHRTCSKCKRVETFSRKWNFEGYDC